jgi:hypothetical protein
LDTASLKEIEHYKKIYRAKDFVDYDGNSINLSKISKVPVAFFVGGKDDFADPTDSKWTSNQIKSVAHYQEIPQFNHYSFLIAKDMSFMKDVLGVVEKFNPRK